MRLLVLGDLHMNASWSNLAVNIAKKHNVDAIFQVGDFGFSFDHFFLKPFKDAPMPVYFIPGNHDNYDYLEAAGAHRGEDEMKELWPNIWHVPRVHVWEWDNRKFAACGGAYSVDKDFRRTHLDYWPQETIRTEDYENAFDRSQKVDVFFSHDVPHGVPVMEDLLQMMRGAIGYHHELASAANRKTLRVIVNQFGPDLLLHGHMHHYYQDDLIMDKDTPFPGKCHIVGLSCDGQDNSMVILDTDDLSVKNVSYQKIGWAY